MGYYCLSEWFESLKGLWTEETFKLVRQGIDVAKKCSTKHGLKSIPRISNDRAESFNKGSPASPLNIVIFHAKVPDHASKINTPDIKGGDQSVIDYEALIKLNVKIARWSQPEANIFIFTDHVSLFDCHLARLHVVRMDVNGDEPMFERSCDYGCLP